MQEPERNRALWVGLAVFGGLLGLWMISAIAGALLGAQMPTPVPLHGGSTTTASATPVSTPAPTQTSASIIRQRIQMPTPAPVGQSRGNPVALGQPAAADDGFEITVLQVERGWEAWSTLAGYSTFNSEPEEGLEYLLIAVRIKLRGEPRQSKRVPEFNFQVAGESGALYDRALSVVLASDLPTVLSGGASVEAELAFLVPQEEPGLVLVYAGSGIRACYFALGD